MGCCTGCLTTLFLPAKPYLQKAPSNNSQEKEIHVLGEVRKERRGKGRMKGERTGAGMERWWREKGMREWGDG